MENQKDKEKTVLSSSLKNEQKQQTADTSEAVVAKNANGADSKTKLSFKQKTINYFKNLPKRYFIDAFSGMAQGLFVTLIAGTIIQTVGKLVGDNVVGNFLVLAGRLASILMGAGIGCGIASYLKAPKMVIFACIVAGFLGSYSTQFLANDSDKLLSLFAKGTPGNPISAYVCSLMACEIGTLVRGKTKLDILIVPITCIFVAILGCFVAWPFVWAINMLGQGISLATQITPFFMGIIIAVVMGVLLTMPTSSAAIWVAIALPIINGTDTAMIDAIFLAGGAAVVGCACQMVGFAVMSFRENKVGGLISQGLGTSMLQIPNIMKKPQLLIPPVIASAILGPISTCVFKLRCTASGGGMGTSGLVGVIETVSASAGLIDMWVLVLGIALLMFILPAVISLAVSEFMRKRNWIKFGDLKLDL